MMHSEMLDSSSLDDRTDKMYTSVLTFLALLDEQMKRLDLSAGSYQK